MNTVITMSPGVKLLYKHNLKSEVYKQLPISHYLNYRSFQNLPVFVLITIQVHVDVYDS